MPAPASRACRRSPAGPRCAAARREAPGRAPARCRLRGMRHVAVVRDVGDRGVVTDQPRAVRQVLFERRQELPCAFGHGRVERTLEHMGDAGGTGPLQGRSGSGAEPALHLALAAMVFGQPAPRRVVVQRKVDQDRVAVGQRVVAVLQHRHLAEGVDREEGRLSMLAGGQLDMANLVGQAEQREHQARPVGMPGKREVVQHQRVGLGVHRGLRGFRGCRCRHLRHCAP